jgi:anaerobic magnesium-protoporphyrin IX monomethyl ester cyclase
MKSAILCFPHIEGEPQFPTGLYKIATHCIPRVKVHVFDERLDAAAGDHIEALLGEEEVLCLGISCMTGRQISSALRLSERFHGRVPIVWGGCHPTILPRQTIDSGLVDYVVRGDGEQAMPQLLSFLDSPAGARRPDWAWEHVHSFDAFGDSYIDFDTYPLDVRYLVTRDGLRRAVTVETSRGCPHRCAYCHNTATGRGYVAMASETVLAVIDELRVRYSPGGVVFQEDNFFVNRGRAFAVVKGLATRGLRWKANCRASYVARFSDDDLAMLSASGCAVLQCGAEAGSQRILDLISKDVTVDTILTANRRLEHHRIPVRYNFIIGFPTETSAEMQQTLALMDRLRQENAFCLHPFLNIYAPYPGTPLYGLAVKEGFLAPSSLEGWSRITWNCANAPWLAEDVRTELTELSARFLKESDYAKFVTSAS